MKYSLFYDQTFLFLIQLPSYDHICWNNCTLHDIFIFAVGVTLAMIHHVFDVYILDTLPARCLPALLLSV